MTDNTELLPCPFCGEDNDLGVGRVTEDREGTPTYIYCGACGMCGPWSYMPGGDETPPIAVVAHKTAWNTRTNKE